MKTTTLFTTFLALLLPLASLVDASNLRKNTEVISDIEDSASFKELFKTKIPPKKVEIVKGFLSSLCVRVGLGLDSTHDLISTDTGAEMEGGTVISYVCSSEAIGFVINSATTALTEATSSDEMMAMTSSFIKEDEDEEFWPIAISVGVSVGAEILARII